ncbi:MAG: hypothetical protein RLZZ481_1967, partial [Pseudomonadota bacterium]
MVHRAVALSHIQGVGVGNGLHKIVFCPFR